MTTKSVEGGAMFIVIDGIDGCGKSTQVKMLTELYAKMGKTLVTSKWKDSEYVDKLFIGDLLKRFQDGTAKIPPRPALSSWQPTSPAGWKRQ